MLKDQILHDLELNSGQPVSGQELADRYHVSRNAVWKAIQALKENNIPILTIGRKGYALPAGTDLITEAGIREHLHSSFRTLPVIVYDEVGSTNIEARKRIADGHTENTLLVTGRQTDGRGHRGGSFASPDNGLYLTLILAVDLLPQELILISKAAAVAASLAVLENCGAKLTIRGVNDLCFEGKKIGGILTEATAEDIEAGTYGHCFTGIGLLLGSVPSAKNRSVIAAAIANYLLSIDFCAPEDMLRAYSALHCKE
jgi:BirA family biotin operon repressor/biotin-[acetyl-CoA-carboxylase] ligase